MKAEDEEMPREVGKEEGFETGFSTQSKSSLYISTSSLSSTLNPRVEYILSTTYNPRMQDYGKNCR
jgi:hypothetical protein